MHKFKDLDIGDMFNTKSSRWVKISNSEAISVMSAMFPLGFIQPFHDDIEVIVLYSLLIDGNNDDEQYKYSDESLKPKPQGRI